MRVCGVNVCAVIPSSYHLHQRFMLISCQVTSAVLKAAMHTSQGSIYIGTTGLSDICTF